MPDECGKVPAHDYNTDRNIAATFQTLPGASFVVSGAAPAHDAGILSFETGAGVDADLTITVLDAGSVADQAACNGGGTGFITGRNCGLCGERHQFVAPAVKERPGSDQKRTGLGLSEAFEGVVDFAFVVRLQDLNRQPDHLPRRLDVGLKTDAGPPVLVGEHGTVFCLRC